MFSLGVMARQTPFKIEMQTFEKYPLFINTSADIENILKEMIFFYQFVVRLLTQSYQVFNNQGDNLESHSTEQRQGFHIQ